MRPNRTRSRLSSLILVLSLLTLTSIGLARAQQAPLGASMASKPTAKTKQQHTSAPAPAKQTNASKIPLQAVATVNASVTVEAGLLPRDSARELFSGWVADHFAVVQIAVGNHSRDQQFILQDVFFDYSHWALSGLYSAGEPVKSERAYKDYQQATQPGQISSIGALEVHDGLKSYSVFSPRNRWVNGLVLVGTTAGGFAFLGPMGFTEAMTGYNSAFIPAMQKFWPDRSIDQQTNVLKYGFQDKMVIAKEDPGKTYAFFPISRFLSKGLADLYRKNPAIFFNPAELFLDPSVDLCKSGHRSSECQELMLVKQHLVDVINVAVQTAESANGKSLQEISQPGQAGLSDAQILAMMAKPCSLPDPSGKSEPTAASPNVATSAGQVTASNQIQSQADSTAMNKNDVAEAGSGHQTSRDCDTATLAVKYLMAGASLNSVRIVVSGIMTVDVETVPATITGVTFQGQEQGESFWNDTKNKHTGIISGKYLSNGKPVITTIKLPTIGAETATTTTTSVAKTDTQNKKVAKAKNNDAKTVTPALKGVKDDSPKGVGDSTSGGNDTSGNSDISGSLDIGQYIDTTSLIAIPESSTDSELHFSAQFKKPIPPGAILTFQVMKTSTKSVNNDSTGTNTSETTSSMTYDYSVDYKAATPTTASSELKSDPTEPVITSLIFKGETAASWGAKGNAIAGTVTGTDLAGGSIEIRQITIPGKTKTVVTDYITQKDINSGTAGSNATTLNFTLTLSDPLPPGTELIFAVTTKDENGKELTSNLKTHSLPKPSLKKLSPNTLGGTKK